MLLAVVSLLFCLPLLNAQSTPDTSKPKQPDTVKPKVPDTMVVANATVAEISSKYQRKEMPSALTIEKVFPVVGTYVSGTDPAVVTIKVDEASKSWIHITGLPQGTIKAMLMRSPAVYKIPAQKSDIGTEIPEGTLIFTPDVNALHICLGKPFEFSNPGAVFEPMAVNPDKTTSPEKNKKDKKPEAWTYSGTKQEVMTTAKQ